MLNQRIPVTIITGFLGAGKTTLLNNLIRKHPEKKFAIIENEFGEIGIDGGLIIGVKDNIFELSNGCICCSLNGDFYEVLERLLESKQVFNHLLIETTGIADPTAIVKAFFSTEAIQMQFRIDSVVCLADAVNSYDLLNTQPEIRKQLALSDTILINKSENADQEIFEKLQESISMISPMANVYPVSFADISELNILDTHSYNGREVETSTFNFRNVTLTNITDARASSTLAKQQQPHQDIQAVGISIPGSFNLDKFNFWMENFLFFNKDTIFRIKGILSFNGMPQKGIFHSVRDVYMTELGQEWENKESRFCKLVFIGKNLNRQDLESSLFKLLG